MIRLTLLVQPGHESDKMIYTRRTTARPHAYRAYGMTKQNRRCVFCLVYVVGFNRHETDRENSS